MALCMFNAHSVKNKSADIYAIAKTCLTADDVAVRMEFCPDGYSPGNVKRSCLHMAKPNQLKWLEQESGEMCVDE